jgi:RNA polymerase sigma-70 factor (sigma-E family)
VTGRLDDEFTRFVTARLGPLRRVAYLLCQDWQRADDLVQIAITRLYVRWERARTMEHPDAYARAILVREFLGERRSGWARRVVLGQAVPETAGPERDGETVLDMRAALASLPPRQRATIVLRYYCDLNVEQTAHLLDCSPGTVKSQTAKALDALRARLGPNAGPSSRVTSRSKPEPPATFPSGETPAGSPGRGRPSSIPNHEVTNHG